MSDEKENDPGQEELLLYDEHLEVLSPDSVPDPTDLVSEDPLSVELIVESLERVTAERDDFRDSLQRLQAEFENFRRRSAQESEQRISAGVARLAEALLPILDACDAAEAQGLRDVEPIQTALVAALSKAGLARMEVLGTPFDPNHHDAMSFETGEGNEQVVAEELRSGYLWSGTVLRPAMVKVQEQ